MFRRCFRNVVFAGTWVLISGCENPTCGELRSILADPARLEYLRNWTEVSIRDPQFLRRAGQYNTIRFHPLDAVSELGLDWQYLGIQQVPPNFYVELNRNDGEHSEDSLGILSVELVYGRSELVLDTAEDEDLGQINYDFAPLVPYDNGAYLICSG